jgi:uncharacterized protein YdhG (YjbR/CyaY superfamily)
MKCTKPLALFIASNVLVIKSFEVYIDGFPENIQEILIKIRSMAKELAPEATESMTYGVPTFKMNGNIFHFAAFKKHLGIYPTPEGIEAFADKLEGYETAKGTIKFPFDKPIPYELIREIFVFRVEEQRKKS